MPNTNCGFEFGNVSRTLLGRRDSSEGEKCNYEQKKAGQIGGLPVQLSVKKG
jgi:hypothetical protein